MVEAVRARTGGSWDYNMPRAITSDEQERKWQKCKGAQHVDQTTTIEIRPQDWEGLICSNMPSLAKLICVRDVTQTPWKMKKSSTKVMDDLHEMTKSPEDVVSLFEGNMLDAQYSLAMDIESIAKAEVGRFAREIVKIIGTKGRAKAIAYAYERAGITLSEDKSLYDHHYGLHAFALLKMLAAEPDISPEKGKQVNLELDKLVDGWPQIDRRLRNYEPYEKIKQHQLSLRQRRGHSEGATVETSPEDDDQDHAMDEAYGHA